MPPAVRNLALLGGATAGLWAMAVGASALPCLAAAVFTVLVAWPIWWHLREKALLRRHALLEGLMREESRWRRRLWPGHLAVTLRAIVALPWAAVVATFVMIFAAGYLLWMFQRVAFGETSDFLKGLGHHLVDMRPVEALTLVPLGALVVVFGLWPGLILDLISNSVTVALDSVQQAAPIALGLWR